MAIIGGDIVEINYSHPTLGVGVIFPKANEDSSFDLGGFDTDDSDDGIDGGGRTIRRLNRTRWSFEVLVAWDMNVAGDLEKIVALAGSPIETTWSITSINGAVYKGVGAPVGPQSGNGNAATFTLKVAGGGVLKKITG